MSVWGTSSLEDNWVSYFVVHIYIFCPVLWLTSVKALIKAMCRNTLAEVNAYSSSMWISRAYLIPLSHLCSCACCTYVWRCAKDWRGHTIHKQTSTICLPTQGTSLPLPPPPSLLFCLLSLLYEEQSHYFAPRLINLQANSHPHARRLC